LPLTLTATVCSSSWSRLLKVTTLAAAIQGANPDFPALRYSLPDSRDL
jgi:hypothetical protein